MAAKAKKSEKLHYDKEKLHVEYTDTFGKVMKVLAYSLVAVLLYFMIFAFYLGWEGHTPPEDFAEQFGDRVDIDYDGKRHPLYETE